MSAFRWIGYCTHCGRTGVELQSRPEHGMRAWCDRCAGHPATTPPLPVIDGSPDCRASEAEVTRWRPEQRERYGDNDRGELLPERQPDTISRVLARLEAVGLPVVGVGLRDVVGSRCPLCGAGMRVGFSRGGVDLTCGAGCPEVAIGEWIRNGGRAR